MQISDPNNQSASTINGTFQPLARNIATALCHQYIHKNDKVWNVGILTPEMERYTAQVLQMVYPELHNKLTTNMPQGKYAFGHIQNTRGLRDALNKAP